MPKIYALIIACLFSFYSLSAQQQPEKIQTFAIKLRYLLFTYGAGAEYFLNRNNSVQLFGVQNAYTFTPSIDPTVESALIAEYRHYFKPDSAGKSNRWFLAPYLKYSHITPGHGDSDGVEWVVERNKDKSIGIVFGRQIFAGEGSMVHFEFFGGPQLGYRHSTEKLFFPDTQEIFLKYSEKFVCSARLGLNMGISVFRKQK